MTEPRIITDVTGRGQTHKQGKLVKCPECEHEWHSRARKYHICPKCEERKTGNVRGNHMRETKGLTMRVKGTDYVGNLPGTQEHDNQVTDPENNPDIKQPAAAAGEGSSFREFMNKTLFKI